MTSGVQALLAFAGEACVPAKILFSMLNHEIVF